MELYIGVILAGIIAFEVFRLLGKKIPKPNKSVEGEAKGIDKFRVFLIAIALAVVIFLAVTIVILLNSNQF
jgi:hypothetical protein